MAENESVATRMYEAMAAANSSCKKVEKLEKEKEKTEERMKRIEEMLSDNHRVIKSTLDLCLSKFDEVTRILVNLTERVEKLESGLGGRLEKDAAHGQEKYPSSDSMADVRQLLTVIGTRAIPEMKGIEKRPVVHPSAFSGSSQLYSPLQGFGPVYKSDLAPFFTTSEPMLFYTKSRFPAGRKCLPVHYQDPELVMEESAGGIKGLWKMVTSTRPTMDVKQYDSLEVASYNESLVNWIIVFGGQIYNVRHLLEQNSPLYFRICNDEKKQRFTEKELDSLTCDFVGEVVVFERKPDTVVQEKLESLTKKIDSMEVLLKQKPREK